MPTPFKGLPPAMIAKYWSWRGACLGLAADAAALGQPLIRLWWYFLPRCPKSSPQVRPPLALPWGFWLGGIALMLALTGISKSWANPGQPRPAAREAIHNILCAIDQRCLSVALGTVMAPIVQKA
jgi:hypothetical protein